MRYRPEVWELKRAAPGAACEAFRGSPSAARRLPGRQAPARAQRPEFQVAARARSRGAAKDEGMRRM